MNLTNILHDSIIGSYGGNLRFSADGDRVLSCGFRFGGLSRGEVKMRIIKNPEERRQEILSIARELFNAKGVENTKVSDIVKKIGVAQGLFYYYFKSKEEVVNAIQEQMWAEIEDKVQLIYHDGELLPQQKIIKYFDLYITTRRRLFENNPGISLSINLKKQMDEKFLSDLRFLISKAEQEGKLKLRYPAAMMETIFYGIREVIKNPAVSKEMINAMLEQGLCLPEGSVI